MSDITLGRLEPARLRDIWPSESDDFTPWLSQEENLALLSDTIGLDLELVAQEKGVGPFRADILCKDTVRGHWVLIENQLEQTDHTHLGQLMTYAAGLDAVVVIWIAERFTEEHRAALDWLNNITGEDANFFALEIEAWRIGASEVAPKFNIVCKPNEWTKHPPPGGELTETQQLQLDYWTKFQQLLEGRSGAIRPRKPFPQGWADFAIGRNDFHLSALVNTREPCIGVLLYIDGSDAKAHFHLLEQDKEAIKAEMGEELEWCELPERRASAVQLMSRGTDPTRRDEWEQQQQWMRDILEAMHRVFAPRVKELDASQWVSSGGDIVAEGGQDITFREGT